MCIDKSFTLQEAADYLKYSKRHLQRKLKDLGVTYSWLKVSGDVTNDLSPDLTHHIAGTLPGQRSPPNTQASVPTHVTPIKGGVVDNPPLSHITPPSNSSVGNDGSMEPPRALNEDAIEQAIARALVQDPIRVLPIAINWMAKKGQITLDTDSQIEGEMRDYYNEVLGMYK